MRNHVYLAEVGPPSPFSLSVLIRRPLGVTILAVLSLLPWAGASQSATVVPSEPQISAQVVYNTTPSAAAAELPTPTLAPDWLPGVNLAGGEFGKGKKLWTNYAYPNKKEIDYYVAVGFQVFRIPFRASRLLHQGEADLLPREGDLDVLVALIDYAAKKDAYVILDMHDYGRSLSRKLIGKEAGSVEEFAQSWGLIAERMKDKDNVIFGLMNEPNKQSATEWLAGANAAIQAIRNAGAGQLILVSGSYWDGAHSWVSSDNDTVMLGVVDPLDNYAFEAHQYLNRDNSGVPEDPVVQGKGADVLTPFTEWLRENGKRGFIGEFGFTAAADYMAEGEALTKHIYENRDVYLGFAYWAGGPWWGDYPFSIEPRDVGKRNMIEMPQIQILQRYVRD